MLPFVRAFSVKRSLLSVAGATFLAYSWNKRRFIKFSPQCYYCDQVLQVAAPAGEESASGTLCRVVDLLRQHLLLALAAAGSAVLAAVTSILSPIYISKIIEFITNGLIFTPDFNYGLAGLLGTTLANAVFTWLYIKLVGQLGEIIASELKVDIFSQLLHESIGFFDRYSVAEMLARLNVDVQEFKHSLKTIITTGLKTGVQLTSTIGQMLVISPKLTLTLSAGLPLIFLIGNVYGRFLRLSAGHIRSIEAEASNVVLEALSSIRTVKAFSAEDHQVQRYKERIAAHCEKNCALLSHIGIFQGLTNLSSSACAASVLFFGGLEVSQGRLSGGQLLAFLMTLQMAQRAVTELVTLNVKFQNMLSSLDRLQIRKLEQAEPPKLLAKVSGAVELRNVSFKYANRNEGVLDSVSLKAQPGEIVAIIGDSGCGKSTIAALMEMFYQPDRGEILFDSVQSDAFDVKNLRSQIGYVHQEPVLFQGSVRENICLGRVVDEAELDRVCKAAHIYDVIDALPNRYDTEISKTTLSGGQKQRITIARALVGGPKIIIFDEATSSLDQFTEAAVLQTICELRGSSTVILITHKLDHLKIADRVYKISEGRASRLVI